MLLEEFIQRPRKELASGKMELLRQCVCMLEEGITGVDNQYARAVRR